MNDNHASNDVLDGSTTGSTNKFKPAWHALLRGGRLVKFKGLLASVAPNMAGVALPRKALMTALATSGLLLAGSAFAVTITTTDDVDSTAGTGIKYVAPGPATTNESGADGIYVQPNTASKEDVTINTNGNTVTGATNGINVGPYASNWADGAITIDAGDVSAKNGIGIVGDAAGNAGDFTVNVGNVTATNDGLQLVQSGAGKLDVTAGDIDAGDQGVWLVNDNFGNPNPNAGSNTTLTTGAVTAVNQAIWVDQQAAGTLDITANGNVQSTNSDGIRVEHFGGDVDIHTKGTVTAAVDGISLGALSGVTPPYDQNVTITADKKIDAGASGVVFHNINQVYGDVNVTTGDIDAGTFGVWIDRATTETGTTSVKTGNITAVSRGIQMVNSTGGNFSIDAGNITADGGGILLNEDGLVTYDADTSIKTKNITSSAGYGILYNGVHDNNVSIDVDGKIDAATDGIDVTGWFGKQGKTLSVTTTGDIDAGGNGVSVAGSGLDGDVSINVGGNITATSGAGVIVPAINSILGNLDVTTGNIDAGTYGVWVDRAAVAGAETHIKTGDINAVSRGVQIVNSASGQFTLDTGDITAAGGGILLNEDGLTTDTADTTLKTKNITSSAGYGVYYTGVHDNNVTIDTTGGKVDVNGIGVQVAGFIGKDLTISAKDITSKTSNAIYALGVQGKGTFTINTTGALSSGGSDLTNGDTIRASNAGALVVNVGKDSTLTAFNNVLDVGSTGADTTLNIDGTLKSTSNQGGGDGVIWQNAGPMTVNINDGATVQATADGSGVPGFVMTDNANADSTVTVGDATVVGGFRLANGNDNLTFNGTDMTNVGTLDGGDDATTADNMVDVLTLNDATNFVRDLSAAGQEVKNWEQVAINGGDADLKGKLDTGLFTLGSKEDSAKLAIGAGNVGDTLEVTGDFKGDGGTILMDADASTHTSDQLVVDGDVQDGSLAYLSFNDLVPEGAKSDNKDISVVDVTGASPGDAFLLKDGNITTLGGSMYRLIQSDGQNWVLNRVTCKPGGFVAADHASLGCVTDDVLQVDGSLKIGGDVQGAGGSDTINIAGSASVIGTVMGGGAGLDDSAAKDKADKITINTTGSVGGVAGNLGDDTINLLAGTVNKDVTGDEGNDTITLNGAKAVVKGTIGGGAGVDTIKLLKGSVDSVDGGDGNDNILLDGASVTGANTLAGGAGDDVINLNSGSAVNVAGDAGNDQITLAGATVSGDIDGGDGNDTIDLKKGSAKNVLGGTGDDTVSWDAAAVKVASINLGAGSDTLNLSNIDKGLHGTKLDGGDDASSADNQIDVLDLNGLNDTLAQDQLKNWETINFNDSNVKMTGSLDAETVNLKGGAFTVLPGGMAFTGDLNNAGMLNMANKKTGDVTKVGGNYTGNGGSIGVDVDFHADTSDQLQVAGTASGSTSIAVNDISTGKASGNDVVVATADKGVKGEAFSLAGGAISKGAWIYQLQNQANQAVLHATRLPVAPLYLSASNLMGDVFNKLPTLEQRVGQRQWLALGGGQDAVFQGVWLRAHGGQATKTPAEAEPGDPITSDVHDWGVQLGADFRLTGNENHVLMAGVTGHYQKMDADMGESFGAGDMEAHGSGGGLNLTFLQRNGMYYDLQAKYTKVKADFHSDVVGDLAKDVDGDAFATSLEVGQRIVLSDNGKHVLVPQGQLTYGELDMDKYTDSVGNKVDMGTDYHMVGRAGIAYQYHPDGYKWDEFGGGQKMFYGIVNLLEDFSEDNTVHVNGKAHTNHVAHTWAELGVGGSFAVSKNVLLYGEASYRQAVQGSSGDNHGASGTFGVRVGF